MQFRKYSVSLDPDDDKRIDTVFDGLRTYATDHMTTEEREHFITVTLKNIAKRAQSLKTNRPPRGLEFSLQQQSMMWLIVFSYMYAIDTYI